MCRCMGFVPTLSCELTANVVRGVHSLCVHASGVQMCTLSLAEQTYTVPLTSLSKVWCICGGHHTNVFYAHVHTVLLRNRVNASKQFHNSYLAVHMCPLSLVTTMCCFTLSHVIPVHNSDRIISISILFSVCFSCRTISASYESGPASAIFRRCCWVRSVHVLANTPSFADIHQQRMLLQNVGVERRGMNRQPFETSQTSSAGARTLHCRSILMGTSGNTRSSVWLGRRGRLRLSGGIPHSVLYGMLKMAVDGVVRASRRCWSANRGHYVLRCTRTVHLVVGLSPISPRVCNIPSVVSLEASQDVIQGLLAAQRKFRQLALRLH